MAAIIGTGKQRSAKASRVLVGAQALTFASWEANMTADNLDTINFESYNTTYSQSFTEGILGPIDGAFSFGGDWDAGTIPMGSPPGIYPRDDLANLSFLTNRADNTSWYYPFSRLRSTKCGGEVKGLITFTASGMNQGLFLPPAGAISWTTST
jgi:hypothetical protein